MQPVTTGVETTIRPLTISACTEDAPDVQAPRELGAAGAAALSTSRIVSTSTLQARRRVDGGRDPIT